MPNQINSKNKPKTYGASDMSWAHEVAEADMQWMSTAIGHLKKEIKIINDLVEDGKVISQSHFSELITYLDMYEYLADSRLNYHAAEAKEYAEEMEVNKKAVTP